MQKEVISIVPDTDRESGVGHINRCLALAGSIERQGAKPILFLPQNTMALEAFSRFSHIVFDDLIAVAKKAKAKKIIFDGYGLPTQWSLKCSQKGHIVIAIDDTGLPELPLDLIINPNAHAKTEMYENSKLLLGTKYALLRNEIVEIKQKKKTTTSQQRILVCMGGADPKGATLTVIDALSAVYQSGTPFLANIVLGPFVTDKLKAEVVDRIKEYPGPFQLFDYPQNFLELLSEADLAVVSGGVVLTESIFLQTPTVSIVLADNQREGVSAWCNLGASLEAHLSSEQISSTVLEMLGNPEIGLAQCNQGKYLVDGKGADRVAAYIISMPVNR